MNSDCVDECDECGDEIGDNGGDIYPNLCMACELWLLKNLDIEVPLPESDDLLGW